METSGNKRLRQDASLRPFRNLAKRASTLLALIVMTGFVASWLIPDTTFQAALENEFIKSLRKKLDAYNTHLPEDRIYLQTDKPLYGPGDDIWLSAFLRDAITMKPSAKSDIVHIELINPKGSVEKKISIIAKNGKAAGDFALDKEVVGGLYKIKAYTNWMKNEGEDKCFIKEIQVQEVVLPNLKMKLDFEKKAFGAGDEVIAKLELNTNENKPLSDHALRFAVSLNGAKIHEQSELTDKDGLNYIRFTLPEKLSSNDGLLNVMIDYNGATESISRSIPIVLNTISFNMYPEGGDLVCGMEGNVAFRAQNEFGKPADVEGDVFSAKGVKITSFSSFSRGMGAFHFNPKKGESYFVKITKPEGIQQSFKVPKALERGYVMSLDNTKQGEISVSIQTTETEELSLVAQVRGKMYYSTVVKALPGTSRFVINTEKFPIGVAQLTLFDDRGIARAERLAFVNRDRQMNISIETEKEKYLPREKVRMTVSVKDERGLPMPANLSMAVVNDQLLSFADDRSGNILSQLLLQQDLKEKVEEPAFYFDRKEEKSVKALDYLLLTSGWRRFTWEKVLEEELPPIHFLGQKALVKGTILNAQTQKPVPYARIKSQGGKEYNSDAEGRFTISKLDLSEPVSLVLCANGFYSQTQYLADYNQDLVYYLYKGDDRYDMNTMAIAEIADEKMEAVPVQAAPGHQPRPMAAAPKGALNKQLKASAGAMKMEEREAVTSKDKRADIAGRGAPMAEKKRARIAGEVHFAKERVLDMDDVVAQPAQNVYYRARQFAAPVYDKKETVETRTDFRNTIYWNPDLEVGYSGRKTIEFYTSDDITSLRATVEGIGSDASVGRAEKVLFTQLPFTLSAKIPVEVATEDLLSIPLVLKNNTDAPIGGYLTITTPAGLQELVQIEKVQTIMPGKTRSLYLDYKVLDRIGTGQFSVSFKSCGLSDAFSKEIRIVPKGFPAEVSFSSQEMEKEYSFEVKNVVKGSLRASFTAFPNVVSDLMKGVEGILQEPYGCFEQTSCTAYPNAMVLDYLKTTGNKDTKTLARATDLLDRGYKRLTGFETSTKGYEWFGANPAHEGLTAYGIMEFVDMKRAGQEVDQKMLDRTAQWLLSHRDGKGGFEREKRALHDFGRISDEVLNGYIVYALADAGYTDIKKEFESAYGKAMSSKDPYLLAMLANAAYSLKMDSKGNEVLQVLLASQKKEGSFNGTTHSITYSQGNSLIIETTALSILAILKAPSKDLKALNQAVHYLTSARSGSGVFSSTQGTILALKSLTEFAKFSKRASEDGTIAIYVDHKKVAEKSYKAGDQGTITLDSLERYIQGEGEHTIGIKYIGVKTPLPYSVALHWNTFLPASDAECSIDIKTRLASRMASVGETVRMTATLTNKKNREVPSTMAIIGIPAGFTAQPWQLKELQDKNVFDYYEIKGNNIAVYYRGLAPAAVKEIQLDLKAEIPGVYDAPASVAYLYYTNEYKTWSGGEKINVGKSEL